MSQTERHTDAIERGFDHPWQIQVFALSMYFRERNLISPVEWSKRLADAMSLPDVAVDGADAHERALQTIEQWLVEQGHATPDSLAALAAAWQRAAAATPHGVAIDLKNDPESDRPSSNE